jgi:hypothetical protein
VHIIMYFSLFIISQDEITFLPPTSSLNPEAVIPLNVLGAEHPDVATTFGNMASAYKNRGDNVKALTINLKVQGAKHPHTKATQKGIIRLKKDIGAPTYTQR